MQRRQNELQLVSLLAGLVWPDTPGNAVFTGGVQVSGDDSSNYLPAGPNGSGAPFALVDCRETKNDPNVPGRVASALYRVRIVVLGTQARHGNTALTGGTRDPVAGAGGSPGRGVDEVLEVVAVGLGLSTAGTSIAPPVPNGPLVGTTHGLQGWIRTVGPPKLVQGLLLVEQELEVEVTDETEGRFYHPVYGLSGQGSSGTVTLSWSPPPARFDTLSNPIIVRYKSGSYPTSPTGGDGSTLVSVTGLASGAVFSPGAGTWYAAVWVAYDEVNSPPSSAGRYSARAQVSVAA